VADTPYLVALALCEFDGQRALPLTGRSRGATTPEDADPGQQAGSWRSNCSCACGSAVMMGPSDVPPGTSASCWWSFPSRK
jgi:hypothetical protein